MSWEFLADLEREERKQVIVTLIDVRNYMKEINNNLERMTILFQGIYENLVPFYKVEVKEEETVIERIDPLTNKE